AVGRIAASRGVRMERSEADARVEGSPGVKVSGYLADEGVRGGVTAIVDERKPAQINHSRRRARGRGEVEVPVADGQVAGADGLRAGKAVGSRGDGVRTGRLKG